MKDSGLGIPVEAKYLANTQWTCYEQEINLGFIKALRFKEWYIMVANVIDTYLD